MAKGRPYYPPAPGKCKVQLVIPDDMLKAARLMAERLGIEGQRGGYSEVMRRALIEYVSTHAPDIARATFDEAA